MAGSPAGVIEMLAGSKDIEMTLYLRYAGASLRGKVPQNGRVVEGDVLDRKMLDHLR